MNIVRKHFHFYGRVQGVGFRYRAKHYAQALHMSGWVRNDYDGTVTMELQGTEAQIDQVLCGINAGLYIQIEWMDTDVIDVIEDEKYFTVKH